MTLLTCMEHMGVQLKGRESVCAGQPERECVGSWPHAPRIPAPYLLYYIILYYIIINWPAPRSERQTRRRGTLLARWSRTWMGRWKNEWMSTLMWCIHSFIDVFPKAPCDVLVCNVFVHINASWDAGLSNRHTVFWFVCFALPCFFLFLLYFVLYYVVL